MTPQLLSHPTRAEARIAHFDNAVRDIASDRPVISYIASTSTEDRYGTTFDISGIDVTNYLSNPVFLWSHDYSVPPIGRTINVKKTKDTLVIDVEFATRVSDFARQIYELVKNKFLPACSIGFIPLQAVPYNATTVPPHAAENLRFTKIELLEVSSVCVPANRDSLARAFARGQISGRSLETVGLRSFVDGGPAPAFGRQAWPSGEGWSPSPETIRRLNELFMRRRLEKIAERWR